MSARSEQPMRSLTPTGDPFLAAKFRIPVPPRWAVPRPRLAGRIGHGVRGPLTTLTAPAGSGKTIATAAWANGGQHVGPVVWITLDAQDHQPGVFWSYVIAALAHAGIPVEHLDAPVEPDSVETSLLTRLAGVLSDQPRPVVLILDDAQVLSGSSAFEGLDFLLLHAAPQLRLVLLSRLTPGLPLYRYRLTGSIAEIRLDELACTAAEARALFDAHHVPLSEPDFVQVMRRTGGWAAGLRLAARSLQVGGNGSTSPDGPSGDVGAYFAAEILDPQPAQVRDFLLRTSVVERLWPGLASALGNRRDGARALSTLAETTAFVTLVPGEPDCYEYHPIVRNLLRATLAREGPDKVPRLHHRAARWLARQGRTQDAIGHAAAAHDWEYAAALVVENLCIGRVIMPNTSGGLAELFAPMPAGTGPEAAVVRAALALSKGDHDLCVKDLLRANELVGARPVERSGALRLAVALTEAGYALRTDDPQAALSGASAVLEPAPEVAANGGTASADMRALALLIKGAALLRCGDSNAAVAAVAAGLPAAQAPGDEHLRLELLGRLALAEAARGRLRAVRDVGRRAAGGSPVPIAQESPPALDVALAWAHLEEYDLVSARRLAERARVGLAGRRDPVAGGMLAVVRARLLKARGDAGGAMTLIHGARDEAERDGIPPWLVERMAAVEAAMRALSGTPEAAAPALAGGGARGMLASGLIDLSQGASGRALDRAGSVLRLAGIDVDAQVDALLLAAAGELGLGRADAARAALNRALRLAEPERMRRALVESPLSLRRFLRQERNLLDRHGWLGEAITGTNGWRPLERGVPGQSGTPVVEMLTAKETEVLRHMAALLSTEEIARTMFVSVNTVKTHVRGVLRKLAATRRNEAVRRAQELRLI